MNDDMPRRGRPPLNVANRADEVRTSRRRRSGATLDPMAGLRLAVPEDVQERYAGTHTLRWVNEDRVHNLTTRDDYDRVDGVEPVQSGTKADGSKNQMHLLAIPNHFYAEKRGEKVEAIDQRESALFAKKGETPAEHRNPNSYVPQGSEPSIRRG